MPQRKVAQHFQTVSSNPENTHASHFPVPSITCLGYVFKNGRMKTSPEQIQSICNWPVPSSHKQLQRFLGFATISLRISVRLCPLSPNWPPPKRVHLVPPSRTGLLTSQSRFSEAPIRARTDTSTQFITEVNASDSGVGTVFSQISSIDKKLHPCTFFSRRLFSLEKNYNVGDKEPLEFKLALEEWWHWLARAEQPVEIWINHKNLVHLQQAKHLNPQSRWSPFFSPFNLVIS